MPGSVSISMADISSCNPLKKQRAAVSSTSAFTAPADACTLPAVAGLSAAVPLAGRAVFISEIDLAWTLNAPDASAIDIYRSTSPTSGFALIGTTTSGSATSYQDTDPALLANTQYYYQVCAVQSGVESAASNVANAWTLPAGPTGLTATASGTSEIDLSWDAITGASGIEIWRSTDGGASYAFLADASSGSATTYADTGLADNTAYDYKVRAVESIIAGLDSTFSEPAGDATVADVSGLTATPASTAAIDLAWTLNVTDATILSIYCSVDGGGYALLTDSDLTTSLTPNSTTYTDSSVSEGHDYSYKLQATISGTVGSFSDPADAWTSPIQNLDYTPTTTSQTLTWTNISTVATAINVYRSTDDATFTLLTTTALSGSAVTYTDSSASENTEYWYEVAITEPGGTTTTAPLDTWTLPNAPSGLSISMSGGEASLSWTNNSAGSPPFYIEQSSDGTSFDAIDETDAGATSYVDTEPDDGTTYYIVAAVSGDGSASNPSGIASVTNAILPPSDLSAQAVSASEVDLVWTNNSAVATGIMILRSTNGGSYTTLTTLTDPTIDSSADTGLSAGTNYSYEVEAVQGSTASAASDPANDTTIPPTPTGLSVAVGPTTGSGQLSELDLAWTGSSGAAGYDIQREATGGTFQDITQVAGGAMVSFNGTGLWDGVTYSYQIDAFNNAGTSAFSSPVTQATSMTIPAAPSNLDAVATVPGSIPLVWQNNAYNETGFIVESSSTGYAGSWSPIGVNAETGVTTAAGMTTYTDSGLAPSTHRYYEVLATNGAGDSTPSNVGNATTSATPVVPPPPAAPTNLAIVSSDGSQTITFQPGTGGGAVSYYVVERSFDGSNFGVVSYGNLLTFNASYGVDYTYRVIARGPGGDSAPATIAGTLPLLAPTSSGVYGTYTWADGSTITIHDDMSGLFGDPQTRPDGFIASLYAGTETTGTPVATATVAVNAASGDAWKTFSGLADGSYMLAVSTYNAAGESTPVTTSVSIAAVAQVGPAPTLSLTSDGSTLTPGYSTDPSAADWEYSPDGTNWFASGWQLVIAAGAGGYVALLRWGSSLPGEYSNAVAVSGSPPPTPTGLTATTVSDTEIDLNWPEVPQLDSSQPAVADGKIGEEIQIRAAATTAARRINKSAPFPIRPSRLTKMRLFPAKEGRTLSDSAPVVGAVVCRGAIGLIGFSDYSNTTSAKANAKLPLNLAATTTATTVHATWDDGSEGETGIEVQLATDNTFSDIIATDTVGPDVTSCDFTGLTPSTGYSVRARNLPSGTDPWDYSSPPWNGSTTALPTVSVTKLLDAAEEGPDGNASDGYFQFTRTGDVSQPLTMNYTVDTSATNAATPGDEYQALSGAVTFAAGQKRGIGTGDAEGDQLCRGDDYGHGGDPFQR